MFYGHQRVPLTTPDDNDAPLANFRFGACMLVANERNLLTSVFLLTASEHLPIQTARYLATRMCGLGAIFAFVRSKRGALLLPYWARRYRFSLTLAAVTNIHRD